jgi:hypothetical protein
VLQGYCFVRKIGDRKQKKSAWGEKIQKIRPRWDSNPQPSDPKSETLIHDGQKCQRLPVPFLVYFLSQFQSVILHTVFNEGKIDG